jgi:hypothetical protein
MKATQTTKCKEKNNTLPKWQQERIKLALEVQKNILDPLMTFAELIRRYDKLEFNNETNAYDFDLTEISRALRLLILGGHIELISYCTSYGGGQNIQSGYLRHILGEWTEPITEVE